MIFGISLTLHLKQLTSLREKCPHLELFCSRFSRIWTEYGEILRIALYSVWMRENGDQKNSEYRHFTNFVLVSCFHFHYCFWIPKVKGERLPKVLKKKGTLKVVFFFLEYYGIFQSSNFEKHQQAARKRSQSIWRNTCSQLTHFSPISHFYAPWKCQ